MKLTEEQKKKLINGFEEAFNSKELPETFKERYHSVYKAMGKDVLAQNGYPKNADIDKGNFELRISPKTSYEAFADNVQEDVDFGNKEEFLAIADNHKFYVDYIMKKVQDINVDFILKDDPNEYLEKNPTEEYLAKEIDRFFDSHVLEERLRESEEFKEMYLAEKAVEEGFDDDVQLDKIRYRIENLEIDISYLELAEYFLDSDAIKGDDTVRGFLNRELYRQIIKHHFYECNVVIETNPLEMEEM
ncbi:hypothetical protein BU107_04710 [Staphylococcus xylosus]|uniref:hypothetical protein n=1 Tax=Staphylococcus xylosus TaxID=1288 RepID=UPI000E69DAD1|nr:hypothetical protein [Staphylococcus xylosus]RIM88907.1 hypothetical protein BU107_04710 [Staphylococcus xylosus]